MYKSENEIMLERRVAKLEKCLNRMMSESSELDEQSMIDIFKALAKDAGFGRVYSSYDGLETSPKLVKGIPLKLAIWKEDMNNGRYSVSVAVDMDELEESYPQIGWDDDSEIDASDLAADLGASANVTLNQPIWHTTGLDVDNAVNRTISRALTVLRAYRLS